MRLEYALEGTSNFYAWKGRMEFVLDDNGLLEYTQTSIPKPVALYAQQLAQWKKDTAKGSRIILEGVRDHVVSNLHGKETTYAMWKTITELFESINDARKLALKDKLKNIRMQKNENIVQYLSRFTHVRDELQGVGESVPPS